VIPPAAFALVLALLLSLLTSAVHAQFIRGPRGGCYTLSKSGAKKYVDRSLCDEPPSGSGANRTATTARGLTTSGLSDSGSPPGEASGKYSLGPRGGCYTLTATGNKKYVDRALCTPDSLAPRGGLESSGSETAGRSVSGRSSPYVRGTKGGCYTITSSGSKRYVDRALCQ